MDESFFKRVAAAVVSVRERIAGAAAVSGRKAEDIRIVAVTKYARSDDGFLEALAASGCREFGEAKPQRLLEKAEYFTKTVTEPSRIVTGCDPVFPRWHLIGPLQRNKVRKMLAVCDMIHSIDSFRLLETVQRVAEEENIAQTPPLLMEVNLSQDETKHGFEAETLPEVLRQAADLSRIRIHGLMGMSGLYSSSDEKRRQFASLRELATSLRGYESRHIALTELSMGMSDDFELAIREGATVVRLGSILYDNMQC